MGLGEGARNPGVPPPVRPNLHDDPEGAPRLLSYPLPKRHALPGARGKSSAAGRPHRPGAQRRSAIIELLSTNLTIIYEKGEDGFWIATIPEVPGAFSQGKTKKEARANAIDAMHELMAARRELALRERIKGATYETLSLQG